MGQKMKEREIVICADDDAWGDTNTGIEKAEGVARRYRLRMAFPSFKDASIKPKDFNDLYLLEGAEVVRSRLEGAENPDQDSEKIQSMFPRGLFPFEVLPPEIAEIP